MKTFYVKVHDLFTYKRSSYITAVHLLNIISVPYAMEHCTVFIMVR